MLNMTMFIFISAISISLSTPRSVWADDKPVAQSSAPQVSDETYDVRLDYDKAFEDMIADGKYELKHNELPEHFKMDGRGSVDVQLHLVSFRRTTKNGLEYRDVTSKEVEVGLEALGLKPAKMEHLLAFGAQYPDKQREFKVVALGSRWTAVGGYNGYYRVPWLGDVRSERILGVWLEYPSYSWVIPVRFLAISK